RLVARQGRALTLQRRWINVSHVKGVRRAKNIYLSLAFVVGTATLAEGRARINRLRHLKVERHGAGVDRRSLRGRPDNSPCRVTINPRAQKSVIAVPLCDSTNGNKRSLARACASVCGYG